MLDLHKAIYNINNQQCRIIQTACYLLKHPFFGLFCWVSRGGRGGNCGRGGCTTFEWRSAAAPAAYFACVARNKLRTFNIFYIYSCFQQVQISSKLIPALAGLELGSETYLSPLCLLKNLLKSNSAFLPLKPITCKFLCFATKESRSFGSSSLMALSRLPFREAL